MKRRLRDVMIVRHGFVRQGGALRVERVVEWILEEVDQWRRVHVGEATQAPREVRRVVVRSERTAEAHVEQLLLQLPVTAHAVARSSKELGAA